MSARTATAVAAALAFGLIVCVLVCSKPSFAQAELPSGSGANGAAITPTSVTTASLVVTGTGSAANNSIQPSGDANTGMRFPAADSINFTTSGTLALQIDAANKVWHTAAVDIAGLLTAVTATFTGKINHAPNSTTCTLNAASPSACTATVTAAATCQCTNVGASAAIAANGCAVGLSGTTLTVTSANGANNVVNIHCDK